MSEQHTPGPWRVASFINAMGGRDLTVEADYDDGTRGAVALIKSGAGYRPHWECPANARLIAAAPELLEALDTIRAYVNPANPEKHDDADCAGEHTDEEHLRGLFDAIYEAADKAIAKARGERPDAVPLADRSEA